MLDFSRLKIASLIIISLGAFLVSAPSFVNKEQREELFSWFPYQTIRLGLDLQGGAHLLLKVNFPEYLEDQIGKLGDEIRVVLRNEKKSGDGKRIGYKGGIREQSDKLSIRLRNITQKESAIKLISDNRRDIDVFEIGENILEIKFTEDRILEMKKHVIEQSIEIVRRRVDGSGTKEPIIQRQGLDRILLQIPGLKDSSEVKTLLDKTAKLTFHLLNPEQPRALPGKLAPRGSRTLHEYSQDGQVEYSYNVISKPIITGDDLDHAYLSFDIDNNPAISFVFGNAGAKAFAKVTTENVGKPFAIVLDGKILSAPRINEPIIGGSGIISGRFTVSSAKELAVLLRAGALPASIEVLEERSVGPSLGADSIESGKNATMIGMLLVVFFMFISYGRFGIYANIALLVNVALVTSALVLIGATLTLPGIAGIVLTMGMAVDANVLIFERIREELRKEKSTFSAIDSGFKSAFTTILDSNITTLIAALLLFVFGSGSVKGFAVTLSIGIISSMFSAILLTRMMIAVWFKRNNPKHINL
jgi:preprotein translocase subunit SecD